MSEAEKRSMPQAAEPDGADKPAACAAGGEAQQGAAPVFAAAGAGAPQAACAGENAGAQAAAESAAADVPAAAQPMQTDGDQPAAPAADAGCAAAGQIGRAGEKAGTQFAAESAPAGPQADTDAAVPAPQAVQNTPGVPDYTVQAFAPRRQANCLLIPIINEGARILAELDRAKKAGVDAQVDIILCDGGSTDGSMAPAGLAARGVNTLLTKTGPGKQGAQLRMGLHYALARGYEGILTIDGNNKDSIESVPLFLEKLAQGYDLVQGSRFVRGGQAVNTPPVRYWAVRLVHAPVISLAARQWFTDTTNAYRAYSRRYLADPRVQPLRDIFMGYELLAYLSVRATQLGYRACEVPVVRAYPKTGKTPTKIKGMRGNSDLLACLWGALTGKYAP